ncbi:hypothetical protein HYH03_010466 [Edaphochlamys debaryana]|uniref:glycerophosphodiester phosphodiesterase n=1 Tax=Edaphochlamys debaryana TaxID=47281 RepID=A0A836BWA3_9CHLO|nr:hypothetical protein HYH03_010466 [Edaphochlamys debaryana]|eukprot:KAG2491260.1 hypothetical protein HYH03_010466 [Edaphochlamys debaryana]
MRAINAAILLLALAATAQASAFYPRKQPYTIGHRGASGLRPEHTIAAYQLAIDLGADFIECDVVLTRDLVPVCRHEPLLSGTTDADQKFPDRIRSYIVDGYNWTGVFSTDLTLAEVKTLRAKQQFAERDQSYNGQFEVPTLEEYIKLAQSNPNRTVGIYPETKHPTWHDSLPQVKAADTTMSDIVLNMLRKYGYRGPVNSAAWVRRPAFIQSFEVGNLKYLSKKTCIPLVQLMDYFDTPVPDLANTTYADLMTDMGIAEVATYAAGVGPWKNTLLVPAANALANATNGANLASSGLAERIRRAGMQANGTCHRLCPQMHPYTFRDEAYRLKYGNFSSSYDEYEAYFVRLGIDGAFTDFPGTLSTWLGIKAQEGGRLWNTITLNAKPKAKAGNPAKCNRV